MPAALPLYAEPAYYRMLFRERTHDLPFYLDASARAAEVVELGVGDGRVAFALAEAGRTVTGVDRARPMLEALEERRRSASPGAQGRVHVEEADVLTLSLGRRFDAVLFPFNGLAHVGTTEEQAAFFETVRAHLSPGGRLAFDVLIPDPELLSGGGASVPRFEHPRTGRVCRMEERYRYEPLTQRLTVETEIVDRESGETTTLALVMRQWFPEETRLLLAFHGFELLERREIGDSLGYLAAPA